MENFSPSSSMNDNNASGQASSVAGVPKEKASTPLVPATPLPHRCRSHAGRIILLSFFFGLLGGYVAKIDTTSPLARIFRPMTTKVKEIPGKNTSALGEGVPADDQNVVSVVEKASPAVVSIVVSKDVPKVRNFFQMPMGFPFFFGGPDDTSGGVDNGSGSGSTHQKVGSGSGFFVNSDGYIVTNKHVVSDSQADYTVIMSDGRELPATVLALDPVNDLAVIKVEGKDFPSLAFGNSDMLKVGQTVIAIGNPLGEFANSVSRGIVSGLKRHVTAGSQFGEEEETLRDIIQTDAAVNPGNSGGPLLDLAGDVIGVNVAVAQGAENIAFAIPVNQIKRSVEEVKAKGKISVPYIGVRYVLLNEEAAKQMGIKTTKGALIQRGQRITDLAVIPGSPADKAGLAENDIILSIDGQAIDADHPLATIIAGKQVGDTVTMKVLHRGDEETVSIKLEERPSQVGQ